MERSKPRPDFKNLARTMLAASLPLASGLSACGDGPTQSGIPAGLESPTRAPIAGPANPTPEPGRTTITLIPNCLPTNPNTFASYNKTIEETVSQHGGAVVVIAEGLQCNNEQVTYVDVILERKDAQVSPYDNAGTRLLGYADGSDQVAIFPATSCEGEYSISTMGNVLKVPDEKTGKKNKTFKLNDDCVKVIILEEDVPKDLN